ncbi:MAG: terminase family protein, partial [Rhodocyclaceae bacterium]|nr:terminase family protein [Rhodocyclaceae bacterium]
QTVRIDSGYEPRSIFWPYHERTQRFSVGVAHRRAGKTVAHIAELIRDAISTPDEARCAYVAPSFTQAKDIAWGYLKRFGLVIPGAEANESELRLDLPNGGRVRLYGAENADRLRGLYFDHVVLDEYAQMRPGIWGEIIRPALSDRQGKASFIGTPMGRNQFWEIYEQAEGDPNWFRFMLRASETRILPESELRDARKTMTPEQYDQEYECSFTAAIIGAYFGKEMAEAEREGRICSVPHDPSVSVQTWWDLGIDDSTVIWFVQYVGREIHVIDYIEANGEALPYYAKELDRRPYRYSDHILPHDAAARELGTGKSRIETLQSLGLRNHVVVPAQDVADGINAARMLLPRCWFDATKCKRGIEALRQYRREYDDKLRAFRSKPLHDWSSHGADAFRTGAMGGKVPAMPRKAKMHEAGAEAWMG